jgi:decaprenylphospho-beta-D-erythro-pentofuranosid-2-ulose 2-reductase
MAAERRPLLLILGARSDIGKALAKVAAAADYSVLLAARNSSQLEEFAECLRHGYCVEATACEFDVLAIDTHGDFLDKLPSLPDIVVCLIGLMGSQRSAQLSFTEAELILRTNLLGPLSILSHVANRMESRGHGAIIAVSSVAGDRGRAENYIYGSAKAGLTTFLSGLRQRLGRTPVRVVTVKLGWVRTRMTAGREGLLIVTPDAIAPGLFKACTKARAIVYLPWYWRPIMTLLCAIPEPVFRRLRITSERALS